MKVFGLVIPKKPEYCPTPCILLLRTGMDSSQQFYGPFANGEVAHQWIEKQPPYLKFGVIPLRNIDRKRSDIDDWYNPDRDYSEADFDPPEIVRSP